MRHRTVYVIAAALIALLPSITSARFGDASAIEMKDGDSITQHQDRSQPEEKAPAAAPAPDPIAAFLAFAKGAWEGSLPLPDDRTLSIFFLAETGPTAESATWKTFLRMPGGDWRLHGQAFIWREGPSTWRFGQTLEDGVAGSGSISRMDAAGHHLRLDWPAITPDGNASHLFLEMKRADEDMIFAVFDATDPQQPQPAFEVRYRRAPKGTEAPPADAGANANKAEVRPAHP